MRPEISSVVKILYPNLADGENVKHYPEVRGVNGKNYFFLNHDFKEDEGSMGT